SSTCFALSRFDQTLLIRHSMHSSGSNVSGVVVMPVPVVPVVTVVRGQFRVEQYTQSRSEQSPSTSCLRASRAPLRLSSFDPSGPSLFESLRDFSVPDLQARPRRAGRGTGAVREHRRDGGALHRGVSGAPDRVTRARAGPAPRMAARDAAAPARTPPPAARA